MHNPSPLAEGEYIKLLVAGIRDFAIYFLDPEGHVSSWNAGAERFKGYTEREVIGQHFSIFYTPEDRADGLPKRALQTARDEGRFEAEGWRVRKDGSRFWANVVIDPIEDAHGHFIGFAKITRDITEKKEAAEALERANAALFQSQKMDAVGKLTGGVAHDFNNLLGVLSGGLDVLSRDELSSTGNRMVESMRRAVSRGARLTEQLLSFARQQPLRAEIIDINALILSFESVLRRAANAEIQMAFNLSALETVVKVDAARLEAALLNLVINARDAMPQGGHIHITTHTVEVGDNEIQELKAGRYAKISVTDTGVGIPEKIRAHIFEPFFTTKAPGKGTGLGLAQVYGFIAQSGGNITVHSSPGHGTTFQMYLPIHVETTMRQVKNQGKVLIVDDEPDVLTVADALWQTLGYDVVKVTNGEDAIAKLNEDKFDILFTDVMLANGIHGIDLAEHARQIFPDMKILLASGYATPVLRSTHAQVDRYPLLTKPYGLAQLQEQLGLWDKSGVTPALGVA